MLPLDLSSEQASEPLEEKKEAVLKVFVLTKCSDYIEDCSERHNISNLLKPQIDALVDGIDLD
jgi:hypothetical protein